MFWCCKKNNNKVFCNKCVYYDDRDSEDSVMAMCSSPKLTEIDCISGKRKPESCYNYNSHGDCSAFEPKESENKVVK